MRIGIIKESNDNRIALTPDVVKLLESEKNEVCVETGAGGSSYFDDWRYKEVGARIEDHDIILEESSMIVSIKPLPDEDLLKLKSGIVLISFYEPFSNPEVLQKLAGYPITVFSLDMIPRITMAQTMDILSSMASVAGYKAVLTAANYLPRYFPMLTSAAGTIPPAKVLILGAGVAGLQAIATARRLGAVVEAFDTRLAAKEEVESLGAKFVMVEGASDDKEAGGYAIEQSEEYKQKQRDLIHEKVVRSDAVITTALLRGKKAPILITKDMVNEMKPGSVIVDLASAGGGNCELTEDQKVIKKYEITIIGNSDLSSEVAQHSSQLFAKNIHNLLKVMIKEGEFILDFENEIIKSACIVHDENVLYKN